MTAAARKLELPRPIVGYRLAGAPVSDERYVRTHFPSAYNIVRACGTLHFDAPYVDHLPPFVERLDPR